MSTEDCIPDHVYSPLPPTATAEDIRAWVEREMEAMDAFRDEIRAWRKGGAGVSSMDIESRAKYLHDPTFHHVVDALAALLSDGRISDYDAVSAVELAIHLADDRKGRELQERS